MRPEDALYLGSILGPFLSSSFLIPFIVWLGMMLLTPATMEGLFEKRIAQVRGLRCNFAKLIFRSLISFVIVLPVATFVLFMFMLARNPIPGMVIAALVFAVWWLYLVLGSLIYAWQTLNVLKEN